MAAHMSEKERIVITFTTGSKVRKWAAENAYMLILMAILFGVTWAYLVIEGIRHAAQ